MCPAPSTPLVAALCRCAMLQQTFPYSMQVAWSLSVNYVLHVQWDSRSWFDVHSDASFMLVSGGGNRNAP